MKDSIFIFACILTALMSGILYGSLGHMYYKKDKHAHKKEKKINSKDTIESQRPSPLNETADEENRKNIDKGRN